MYVLYTLHRLYTFYVHFTLFYVHLGVMHVCTLHASLFVHILRTFYVILRTSQRHARVYSSRFIVCTHFKRTFYVHFGQRHFVGEPMFLFFASFLQTSSHHIISFFSQRVMKIILVLYFHKVCRCEEAGGEFDKLCLRHSSPGVTSNLSWQI